MVPSDLPSDPVSLVQGLLERAVAEEATDIHFDPAAGDCRVRVRIDGLLTEIARLEAIVYPKVGSRIKVLAELDLTERRRPQDGRFSLTIRDRPVDFRVSCIPTLHGESIALRIHC